MFLYNSGMTNNAKAFGSALSRIRKEQGFPSAYKFYKTAGGSKSLGLAFVSYWDMERGKKLPKSWRLKEIMAALGIEQNSPRAKELVRAYFKALSGSDELLHVLAERAPADGKLSAREPAEAAVQKILSQHGVNQTLDQWKACARDIVTFMCDYYLDNTTGWVTVRELCEATKFKPEAVKKALKPLAAAKLVELSGDKARSRFEVEMVKALPLTPETAPVRAAVRGHMDTWIKDASRVEAKRLTVRLSKANLDSYREHLGKAVNLASAYSNSNESKQDSAVYLVDAAIYKILPKK